jgi:hypothetical protein
MEPRSVRNTYRYRLEPTPDQARVLELVVWRCRMLYNLALEQRKTWWERGQGDGRELLSAETRTP